MIAHKWVSCELELESMAAPGVTVSNGLAMHFLSSDIFGTRLIHFGHLPVRSRNFPVKPLVIKGKANTRTEKAKTLNIRKLKKFNGTATKPRLSVFCSDNQLYAMLVDDQNKKCLYNGNTLQKSVRGDPPCSTTEAAMRVGEDLIKTCIELKINEISSYDRNGFARGERLQAFEIAISRHGFLSR